MLAEVAIHEFDKAVEFVGGFGVADFGLFNEFLERLLGPLGEFCELVDAGVGASSAGVSVSSELVDAGVGFDAAPGLFFLLLGDHVQDRGNAREGLFVIGVLVLFKHVAGGLHIHLNRSAYRRWG